MRPAVLSTLNRVISNQNEPRDTAAFTLFWGDFEDFIGRLKVQDLNIYNRKDPLWSYRRLLLYCGLWEKRFSGCMGLSAAVPWVDTGKRLPRSYIASPGSSFSLYIQGLTISGEVGATRAKVLRVLSPTCTHQEPPHKSSSAPLFLIKEAPHNTRDEGKSEREGQKREKKELLTNQEPHPVCEEIRLDLFRQLQRWKKNKKTRKNPKWIIYFKKKMTELN